MNKELKTRNAINDLIEEALDDALQYVEENRYEPSVRGAGTAPTDSAVDNFNDIVRNLITDIGNTYGVIDALKVNHPLTFEECMGYITDDETADEISELEEIDSYDDNRCDKYFFVNTIYKHSREDKFLEVCVRHCARGSDFRDFESVREVEKKEKVTYEWS